MEAANHGAHDVETRSVGLNFSLPHQQYSNPHITPDLCFRFHYFVLRKLDFLLAARVLVVFPLRNARRAIGDAHAGADAQDRPAAESARGRDTLAPCRGLRVSRGRRRDRGGLRAVPIADSAQEIWAGILRWHEMRGKPLLHTC